MNKEICPYCKKEFTKYGIKGHIWRKHTEKGKNHKPFKNKKAWNSGLTKEIDERVKNNANSIKQYFEQNTHNWIGRKHTCETKEKMSSTRKEMYKNGWEASSCGKSKKYKYNSKIAGNIIVDGKWELSVAKYLDSLNLSWKRNTKRFSYTNLNGKLSTYCPDFWVDDWKTYIEVKGYETNLDRCKWNQFKHPLQIWKADKLIKLNLINNHGEVV